VETAEFEYFFIGEDGFIGNRDQWYTEYKNFKISDEVVKSKKYDSFETVDYYGI